MEGKTRSAGLSQAPNALYEAARSAIHAEHRQHNQWTALRCRSTVHSRGTIWQISVSDLSAVSWAWEGATALCPIDPMDFDPSEPDTLCWRGVVVSLDSAAGHLYVDISHSTGERPDAGTFLVRPYAFLASLHQLYVDPLFSGIAAALADALQATAGNCTGTARDPDGMPEIAMATNRSWGILWGPPGTGKTWTIGRHVARLWPQRRVLVVSTTNRATDGVTLSIARAILDSDPGAALKDRLVRVGSGADLERFVPERLTGLLAGGEVGLRQQLLALRRQRARSSMPSERAVLSARLQEVRRALEGCSREVFLTDSCRVVVTTAFNALRQLTDPDLLALAEGDRAPFDLIVVDEAGLVCRAAAAALSLLAAKQVLFVGDPRQLAPIARMSRLLPPEQAAWLSESALSHLDTVASASSGAVCMLRTQHRMHPEIRSVISRYQYDDQLEDGPGVTGDQGSESRPSLGLPRAGWLVLEESSVLVDARAERGPRGRSWVRPCTPFVLSQLLEAHPGLSSQSVMVVTPFSAQARALAQWLQAQELSSWTASTIHSQQGSEADVVIFDTVSGGLSAWPPGEWQRLINVGLSRARSHVLLLATRDEMASPWLLPLQDLLAPCALRPGYGGPRLKELPPVTAVALPARPPRAADGLGAQLAAAQAARPVLSVDQERLVSLPLDGGPRLVRGVAGSGKTLVLAHWLARALAERPEQTLWVVYGNASLQRILADRIVEAWRHRYPGRALPWRRVALWHIRDLLRVLLPARGLSLPANQFDYDPLCRSWLSRDGGRPPRPRCAMLFIDEAQDFGPQTLRLLIGLAAAPDPALPGRRPVMIFYDHDQNVYHRASPRWSALGLVVEGRTALLQEGFRSTRPITTAALNTLYRLRPPSGSPAYRQLLSRGLVQPSTRSGHRWWQVRFSAIDGPLPELREFSDRESELLSVVETVNRWVLSEGVAPGDIRILCYTPALRDELLALLAPSLEAAGFSVCHQTGRELPSDPGTLLITTPHSFKGHDAEVVVIPGVDRLTTRAGPLAHVLYVAMTRARSMLLLSALRDPVEPGGAAVLEALRQTISVLGAPPSVTPLGGGPLMPQQALLQAASPQHLSWLASLWASHPLRWEPLNDLGGGLVLTPLFWFECPNGRRVACFSKEPEPALVERLDAAGIAVIRLGGPLPEED